MPLAPEIRARLVYLLYTALPQVVSSTVGTLFLAVTVWWRVPSLWTAALIVPAAILVVVRIGVLFAYRRSNGDAPPAPERAPFWERLYGTFSIIMAFVLAAIMLTAFSQGDSGLQLLTSGVAIGVCGGQSTTRVTCRPWIPLAFGSVVLTTLIICSLIWQDPLFAVFTAFATLYLYTFVEACRHSARTLLGRLVAEAELATLVRRDSLTALANRLGFEEELDRALSAMRRNRGAAAMLMLDLDGFKAVNDRYGHPAGDAVLRGVADRLREVSRRTDFLARMGGDEFAVVVTDRHDRQSLTLYARRLITSIREPFTVAGHTLQIGVSIGIVTVAAQAPCEAAEILAAADAALYQVKNNGKNNLAFAEPSGSEPDAAAVIARPAMTTVC